VAGEADGPQEGVHCPMCNLEASGSNEDNLFDAFRQHLATTHKDEPFVTQLMGDHREEMTALSPICCTTCRTNLMGDREDELTTEQ
jgi:predicted small metal-binding protein